MKEPESNSLQGICLGEKQISVYNNSHFMMFIVIQEKLKTT